MNGHTELIAMRRAGRIPRCVWITDGPDARARDWTDEVNIADRSYHAVVSLDPADVPELLDLRFAIGLEIHLQCFERRRAMRLHQALVDARARKVITTIHYGPEELELLTHGLDAAHQPRQPE